MKQSSCWGTMLRLARAAAEGVWWKSCTGSHVLRSGGLGFEGGKTVLMSRAGALPRCTSAGLGKSSPLRYFCSVGELQKLRSVRVTHGWDTKELQVPAACTVDELLEKLSVSWDIDPSTATLYESRSKQKLDSASGSKPLFQEEMRSDDGSAYRLLLLAPSAALQVQHFDNGQSSCN